MLVLCGYSGSGKDTILRQLVKMGYNPMISYTTRNRRCYETDGVDYHYVSEEEFERYKDRGYFAETTSYNTINGIKYYGTALKDYEDINKVVILNPDGIRQLAQKNINMLICYISCNEDVLRGRLSKRGDDPKEVERRLETDKNDFADITDYYDITVINDGHSSIEDLASIIDFFYKNSKTNNVIKKGGEQ